MAFFDKLKTGLSKTKSNFTDKITDMLKANVHIDEDMYEELEELLITADIGMESSVKIIENLRNKITENKVKDIEKVRPLLKEVIVEILNKNIEEENIDEDKILLIIGINGVGKTTSIGKLAHKYKNQGKKVLIAAGDTFRAAAIDQLDVWCKRVNVDIVKQQEGSDPAAVIFDSVQAAKARKVNYLICDTAGRLHNKKNLMDELSKINRIINREASDFKKESLLVIDATTGQNGVSQAKEFSQICELDGIILTKLDGTAKGGIIISIVDTLNIPVKYIGIGEGIEDLQEFNPTDFVEALF